MKYHLVSTAEAARMCGVTTRTIRAYIREGKLTILRREFRKVWLNKEAVEALNG